MKRHPARHERLPHQRTRTTLAGLATLLAALVAVWLSAGGTAYAPTGGALSTERKTVEASHDDSSPQVIEANRLFMERARAMEAGFKAAFLFNR